RLRWRLSFRLAVSGAPTPDFRALAALQHAVAIDVGDHVSIAPEQRLCRAHFGASRKLAFRQAVTAVLPEFGRREVGLGAAGAERALVHLAAQAERAILRELRRAERTGVEAVAAADAQVLVVQHHAFSGLV